MPFQMAQFSHTTTELFHTIYRKKGHAFIALREELGSLLREARFAPLVMTTGRRSEAPVTLALVTILQFSHGVSDAQAAKAVIDRIDWKYLLDLDIDDPGFDAERLAVFRQKLLADAHVQPLVAELLAVSMRHGLVRTRGKQRGDPAPVLAAICTLARVEQVYATLRTTLNAIAEHAPDWLIAHVPVAWADRYGDEFQPAALPRTKTQLDSYRTMAVNIGQDGAYLLDALGATADEEPVRQVAAVETLRVVWARHYERGGVRVRWRETPLPVSGQDELT